MRNLISIRDLGKKDIESILALSEKMEKRLPDKNNTVQGKLLATLFFEPSTRTKLSFQAAAVRLGMKYIDFLAESSSLKKGETFIDTIKVVSGYADVLVVRHPKEGSAKLAADVSGVPVINGGDGGNQHPTQTLIDLYTIKKGKRSLNGLNVVLVGDHKHARVMHSLVYALSMFDTNITLVAPVGLEMPEKLLEEIRAKFNARISISQEMDFKDADVVYTCRIQEERFADPYEAKRIKEQFAIREGHLRNVKKDLMILNPLPKTNEIAPPVDNMPYARYFEQAHNGVPVRMAVMEWITSR